MFNAPFHCFEKIVIFNNWKTGGAGGHYYE